MKSVERTIQAQYANSPTLLALIHNMDRCIDPSADIDNFYNVIFNVSTAIGFGLDIWGRIVGIGRQILTSPVNSLDDEAYRQLIFLKALTNITRSTIPAVNQLLLNWLGPGSRAYVNDLGGMHIRYTFETDLTPVQQFIVQKSGIFPRPAGVGATILQTEFPVFGFSEMGTEWITPFNDAPFLAESATNAIN